MEDSTPQNIWGVHVGLEGLKENRTQSWVSREGRGIWSSTFYGVLQELRKSSDDFKDKNVSRFLFVFCFKVGFL